jgi:hypothetical protein
MFQASLPDKPDEVPAKMGALQQMTIRDLGDLNKLFDAPFIAVQRLVRRRSYQLPTPWKALAGDANTSNRR